MNDLEMKLIRTMNEVIRENESQRQKRMKTNLNCPKDSVKTISNKSECAISLDKFSELKKKEDYLYQLNVLYSQLVMFNGTLFGYLKRGIAVSADEWRKLTNDLVEAYNFAAGDNGCKLQFIEE